MRGRIRIFAITSAILYWSSAAFGATFVVNSTLDAVDAYSPGNGVCATVGAVCTLRAAVQEANALKGPHVLTLPAGTYVLTIAGRGADDASGDLNVGPLTAMTINGIGSAVTIIDANKIDRAFNSLNGGLTLNDVTVQNGDPMDASGGCLTMSASPQLTLNRVVLKGCNAGTGRGGAIFVQGLPSTTLTVTDTTIMQNTSSVGGGIWYEGGTATITRTTISGNVATAGGGAIYSVSDGAGGGISSFLKVANSTLAQNVSANGGALMLAANGPFHGSTKVSLINTTVADNTTTGQDAAAIEGSSSFVTPELEVKNTIIANSAASANCLLTHLSDTDLGNNLEFPGTSCGFGLPSDRRANPLLGALTPHGGWTFTMPLLRGSPGIDAGEDAACAAAPVSDQDQRGASRSARAGVHCDIGAFELPATMAPFDFDGDNRTDRTVFRRGIGVWFSALSGGSATATGWGTFSDVDVAADYDGDGVADIAFWRPSVGQWAIVQSNTGTVRVETWGVNGDIPLAGDVDGDGKADLVIWRPSSGSWYTKKSTGGTSALGWGMSGDIPLLADFDGDGKLDFTIYRPTAVSVWYVALQTGGFQAISWGLSTDDPVVGDWDGDGKADAAIFRPSTGQWFIKKSSGGILGVTWGTAGDIPMSGDADGDGTGDYIIWRPSTGVWYTQFGVGGSAAVQWGMPGDRPIGRVPGS